MLNIFTMIFSTCCMCFCLFSIQAQSKNNSSHTPSNHQVVVSPVNVPFNPHATGQEDIAFNNDRDDDTDLQKRYFNRGNWDYRENWQYDRDAYLSGQNQETYHRTSNDKPGIGN